MTREDAVLEDALKSAGLEVTSFSLRMLDQLARDISMGFSALDVMGYNTHFLTRCVAASKPDVMLKEAYEQDAVFRREVESNPFYPLRKRFLQEFAPRVFTVDFAPRDRRVNGLQVLSAHIRLRHPDRLPLEGVKPSHKGRFRQWFDAHAPKGYFVEIRAWSV